MNILGWIKAASGGVSAVYLYMGLLLAGVAAATGAWWWHENRIDDLHETSFAAGRTEAESENLREAHRELARLVGVVAQQNEVYLVTLQALSDAESAAATADQRVRQLATQRRTAIATAPAEAVRQYAAAAHDVYQACRAEYRALGFDAARCSATAHTLNDYATEVSRTPLSMPRSPLTKNPTESAP